jgi:hypothetical protein
MFADSCPISWRSGSWRVAVLASTATDEQRVEPADERDDHACAEVWRRCLTPALHQRTALAQHLAERQQRENAPASACDARQAARAA